MRTTFRIDDKVLEALKQRAAREGRTMSELAETALRVYLRTPRQELPLKPLPRFDMGRMLLDITDRDALDRAL